MYTAMTFKDNEKELLVSDCLKNDTVKIITRFMDEDRKVRLMELALSEDEIRLLRNHLSKQLKAIK